MSIPREKLNEYWWYRLVKGIYCLVWAIWFFVAILTFSSSGEYLKFIIIGFAFVLWIIREFFLYIISGNKKK